MTKHTKCLYPVRNRMPHKPDWLLIILLVMLGLMIVWAFTGCKTPQQLIDKAMDKDPKAVARYTRDKFPCTEVLQPDTAIVFRDTTIYVDCPDTVRTAPFETVVTDTVDRVVTRTVRVPVTVRLPGTTITKWYEDSTKIFLLQKDIDRLRADTATLIASRDSWKGKAESRGWENWIWRIIATIFILWKAWGIYKRATTIKVEKM